MFSSIIKKKIFKNPINNSKKKNVPDCTNLIKAASKIKKKKPYHLFCFARILLEYNFENSLNFKMAKRIYFIKDGIYFNEKTTNFHDSQVRNL